MLTRSQKEHLTKEFEDGIRNAGAILFTNYRGLKVKDVNTLRAKLKKAGARLRVVRKTLLARAFSQYDIAKEQIDALPGQLALAFVESDPIAIAKVLAAFRKEHDVFELTGGFVGGRLLSAQESNELAKLPGFQELRSQLVGMLAAPLNGLVRAINWPIQSLVYTLGAIKK